MTTRDSHPGWPDEERLMAYADGELEPAEAARIAAAIAADPALAARVERHRALRGRLQAAYSPVLDEPVPARLRRQLAPALDSAGVGEMGEQDESGSAPAAPVSPAANGRTARPRRRWTLREWAAMAACLALGWTLAQTPWWRQEAGEAHWIGGTMVAQGELARSLDTRLTADGPTRGGVRVGLGFRERDGGYCRGFRIDAAPALAGLACRDGGHWRVVALAQTAAAAGDLRQAASDLPPAVLSEVDARIEGEPLDAAAERAARDSGWR